jgi:hypothetical protein
MADKGGILHAAPDAEHPTAWRVRFIDKPKAGLVQIHLQEADFRAGAGENNVLDRPGLWIHVPELIAQSLTIGAEILVAATVIPFRRLGTLSTPDYQRKKSFVL